MAWDPPAYVGHFAVRSVIGIGSAGKVFHADFTDPLTGRVFPFALKFMYDARAAERERDVLLYLGSEHDNIVRLAGFEPSIPVTMRDGTKVPFAVLVMELATNGPLFFYISKRLFPTTVMRACISKVAEALMWSAERGVTHGDVKPENILFDDSFNIKLGDWGHATVRDPQNSFAFVRTVDAIGTLPYTAPEVLIAANNAFETHLHERGKGKAPIPASETSKRLDSAADAWSLGIVMFVLLVGRNPFNYAAMSDAFFSKTVGVGDYALFWAQHESLLGEPFDADAKDAISALLVVDPVRRATLEELLRMPFFTQNANATNAECAAALGVLQEKLLPPRRHARKDPSPSSTASDPSPEALSVALDPQPTAQLSDDPLSSASSEDGRTASPVFRCSPASAQLAVDGSSGGAASARAEPRLVAWLLPPALRLRPWAGGSYAGAASFASRLTTREYPCAPTACGVSALLEEARVVLAQRMYGAVRLSVEPTAAGFHDVELHAHLPRARGEAPVHLIFAVAAAEGGASVGVDVTRGPDCASALAFALKATALLECLDERLLGELEEDAQPPAAGVAGL